MPSQLPPTPPNPDSLQSKRLESGQPPPRMRCCMLNKNMDSPTRFTSHLRTLCLSVLILKMRTAIILPRRFATRIKYIWCMYRTVLAYGKLYPLTTTPPSRLGCPGSAKLPGLRIAMWALPRIILTKPMKVQTSVNKITWKQFWGLGPSTLYITNL